MPENIHNPDRYMADLRQILAQGRKRLGLLLGAGAPVAIKINRTTKKLDEHGEPLIPAIAGITTKVLSCLTGENDRVSKKIIDDIGGNPNIEAILSRIRSLAELLGAQTLHGYTGAQYRQLAVTICGCIAQVVAAELPEESNPYTELASWVGGTDRTHPVEVFTTNYDLLFEEALERLGIPFFDGFTGSYQPFFNPSVIANDQLPSNWVRLWKLHGSLGWKIGSRGNLFRGNDRDASELIYPDHLKYDQVQKLPYTALFDRLRKFLTTPDTLLLTCGFSFLDAHIVAVLDESLAANPSGSIFAFQYRTIDEEQAACAIAMKRPNMSVYAADKAMINGLVGRWQPGEPPSLDWLTIRQSFWANRMGNPDDVFLLGDFVHFARFFALAQAEFIPAPPPAVSGGVAP